MSPTPPTVKGRTPRPIPAKQPRRATADDGTNAKSGAAAPQPSTRHKPVLEAALFATSGKYCRVTQFSEKQPQLLSGGLVAVGAEPGAAQVWSLSVSAGFSSKRSTEVQHEDEGGRWGRAHLRQPVRPVTVRDYYNNLHTFFKFVVAEGVLESSPMDQVPVPVYRADQKEPFTSEQVSALLQAARRSTNAKRDELICLLLLDTGIRASELTGLKVCDVDLQGRSCIVRGKGNKTRSVLFGVAVASALRAYVRGEKRSASQPLFVSDRGAENARPLTRSGLLQLIQRLGEAAGIKGSACNVHRMRRTFAVEWLRGGGNVFSLQAMLGHTNLQMTQRYLALARSDIEAQARQFSPADRIQGKSR